jgi:hypothetical protein
MECVGKIITVPCKQSELWSHIKMLLCSGPNVIGVVEIDHITLQGKHYVVGDDYSGTMEDDMYLAKPYFKTEDKLYPLKPNQWKQVVKAKEINSVAQITCTIEPTPYKDGFYARLCEKCFGHFSGGKTQQTCEDCSEELRHAKIISSKRPKRTRIRTHESI